MLEACSNVGAIGKGQDMYTGITQKGLEIDVYVDYALVGMYEKCDSLWQRHKAFEKLPSRNTMS